MARKRAKKNSSPLKGWNFACFLAIVKAPPPLPKHSDETIVHASRIAKQMAKNGGYTINGGAPPWYAPANYRLLSQVITWR
jgi:hypothetical protein